MSTRDGESGQSSEDGLIHWLDERFHKYHHVVFPEDQFKFKDDDLVTYEERFDDGQVWYMRRSSFGRVATLSRYSMNGAVRQMAYTREQYKIVAWGLWACDNLGMSDREVWAVIFYGGFWKLWPGQTPFVSRTVTVWKRTRQRMAMKGRRWP